MFSEFADGRIVTNIELELEQVLKGDLKPNETIRLVEPGGIVGSEIMVVSAAPTYWKGNRALIFLTMTAEGQWQTYGASLGKFDFVKDGKGRGLAVRWATGEVAHTWTPDGNPHEEKMRDAVKFAAYIERMVRMNDRPFAPSAPGEQRESVGEADYFIEDDPATESLTTPVGWLPVADGTYPPSAYTQGTFRWNVFDATPAGSVTFRISGSQPGHDSVGAAQRSLAAWTNDSGSNVQYLYGGTTTAGFVKDNNNTIVYNSTTGVPAGALAYAQWFGGAVHTYKGESFYSITEGDVVVKSGINVSAKLFDEAVTHELGHTLGFRHSDAGTPSSTQAVMKASLSGTYGATLGPWDIEAVRTVYEGTSTPTIPPVPTNLVARATSTTSILVTWNASAGATSYRLYRSENDGAYALIASPATNSYTDSGRTAGKTYVYRVQAVAAGLSSADSNRDHATTILFTDDPLVAEVDVVRAVHLTQLRTAVNAVRAAAGLAAATWTDSSPAGVAIKRVHITQLRSALTPALTALGKSSPSYTDASLTTATVVKAVHFQELRNLTK